MLYDLAAKRIQFGAIELKQNGWHELALNV